MKRSSLLPPAHRCGVLRNSRLLLRLIAVRHAGKRESPILSRASPRHLRFSLYLRAKSQAAKSWTTANLWPCCLQIEINSWRYPKATTCHFEMLDEQASAGVAGAGIDERNALPPGLIALALPRPH
jgi:hypothetical protein